MVRRASRLDDRHAGKETALMTGIVAFDIAGLSLDRIIRIIEELPPSMERFFASCVDEAGAPLAITYEILPQNVPPIAAAYVAVGDKGDVRCDWYNALAT